MHFYFFFFNDTAPTEIYTLSLHDALPISYQDASLRNVFGVVIILLLLIAPALTMRLLAEEMSRDRKSTRLNSSHRTISYAVFCLKKKKKKIKKPAYTV